jgi:hypothetical protein
VVDTPHREGGLTYRELLQVSLLAYVFLVGSAWLFGYPPRVTPWIPLLFQVLVVNPAIAAIAFHIPFLGFRMLIVPNAPRVRQL